MSCSRLHAGFDTSFGAVQPPGLVIISNRPLARYHQRQAVFVQCSTCQPGVQYPNERASPPLSRIVAWCPWNLVWTRSSTHYTQKWGSSANPCLQVSRKWATLCKMSPLCSFIGLTAVPVPEQVTPTLSRRADPVVKHAPISSPGMSSTQLLCARPVFNTSVPLIPRRRCAPRHPTAAHQSRRHRLRVWRGHKRICTSNTAAGPLRGGVCLPSTELRPQGGGFPNWVSPWPPGHAGPKQNLHPQQRPGNAVPSCPHDAKVLPHLHIVPIPTILLSVEAWGVFCKLPQGPGLGCELDRSSHQHASVW